MAGPERKKVLVTGASSGIGRATALRFAREGWLVCVNARREALLREVAGEMPGEGHLACAGDYADDATADRIHETVAREWRTLDALVNCAGVSMSAGAIGSAYDEWRKPLDIMINGAVKVTRTAVPFMINGGRIIHITSIHAGRAENGSSAYAMAKAALNQYCRGLALELASCGILVNAIAPGFIDTPMSSASGINELETEWFRRNYIEGHHLPLRRAGRPEEIAGVALFLAGPDASYLTGQVITVDGGLTITF